MRFLHSLYFAALTCAPAALAAIAGTPETVADRTMKHAGARLFFASDQAEQLNLGEVGTGLSWQAEGNGLNKIRDAVNEAARDQANLQLWTDMETPAEQEAVRAALPILQEMVKETEAAIDYLNHNQDGLQMKPYTDHLARIAADGDRLHELYSEPVKLNALSRKEQKLKQDIIRVAGD